MKRIILVILAAGLLLPIPKPGQVGAYNTISRLYYCTDEYSCFHELGHYIDYSNGLISHGTEYREAVALYALTQRDAVAYAIAYSAGTPIEELYAHLYGVARGNMPEALQAFYPAPNGKAREIQLPEGFLVWHTQQP